MRRVKSMLLTVGCAGMILGAGYFVIVKSGQKVLEKERVLEESVYEDTSSNIFYGKIEENIELFPWNCYPEEGEEKILGEYPRFGELVLQGNDKNIEEELKSLQEWYLCQLIAWECDTSIDNVRSWYTKNETNIMDHMVMVDNFQNGFLYFYQDILQLEEKQFQVRIACNEWNIISFICMEYRNGQKRDWNVWEQGKEKLVTVLESMEEEMKEYFEYMLALRYQGLIAFYDDKSGEYSNTYLEGFHWLKEILRGKQSEDVYIPEEIQLIFEKLGYYAKEQAQVSLSDDVEKEEHNVENAELDYSYQIVELKNMILLLMQREQQTLGVYYDPIAQRFCGYNFFYEY